MKKLKCLTIPSVLSNYNFDKRINFIILKFFIHKNKQCMYIKIKCFTYGSVHFELLVWRFIQNILYESILVVLIEHETIQPNQFLTLIALISQFIALII